MHFYITIIFLFYNHCLDILLILAYFLQACYDIYFFHSLVLYFFVLLIILYINFLLDLLFCLFYFYNSLLLYLILSIYFFDNKQLCHSFLYIIKKLITIQFFHLSQSFLLYLLHHDIPKINSIIASFNRNNSKIIKIYSFLH